MLIVKDDLSQKIQALSYCLPEPFVLPVKSVHKAIFTLYESLQAVYFYDFMKNVILFDEGVRNSFWE